jgi:hypothetical protein
MAVDDAASVHTRGDYGYSVIMRSRQCKLPQLEVLGVLRAEMP